MIIMMLVHSFTAMALIQHALAASLPPAAQMARFLLSSTEGIWACCCSTGTRFVQKLVLLVSFAFSSIFNLFDSEKTEKAGLSRLPANKMIQSTPAAGSSFQSSSNNILLLSGMTMLQSSRTPFTGFWTLTEHMEYQ